MTAELPQLPSGLSYDEVIPILQEGRDSQFWTVMKVLVNHDREALKESLVSCTQEELPVLQAKAANLEHVLELPDIVIGNFVLMNETDRQLGATDDG